jgi:hypothetical protein
MIAIPQLSCNVFFTVLSKKSAYLSENRRPFPFVHPSVAPDGAAPIEELCAAGRIVIRGAGGITELLR